MREFLPTALLLLAACGPGEGDEGNQALRDELAGTYSGIIGGLQVSAHSTRISIYEFREDGTGVFQRLSCDGVFSADYNFEWSVDTSVSTHAEVVFDESYGGRAGQWELIGEPCTAQSFSRVDIERGDRATLRPGRRCNPQLGPSAPDGLQACEFEVCGEVSRRCSDE